MPSTCVGGARPCAGCGAIRARSAAPQRPRTPSPSPSEPGPSLYLRPLGRYSSGTRGATAVQASALEPSVNELIDATFVVAILAQKPPVLCPKGHQPFGTKAQHATLLMHLNCCNFRPTGPFGITLRAGWVMDGAAGLSPHCHWPSRTI